MDQDGLHDHGGFVGNNGNFATGTDSPGTDTQLGESDVMPPYLGLCYIMKCRTS
jgi:hypothetical protein